MPAFGGYDVWVEVEGKRLEEFDFDEEFVCDGVPLLTSHIASEAGKVSRN